jgi:tetratricopeptide (TPR) repeat protein
MPKITFLQFGVSETVPPGVGRQLGNLLGSGFGGVEGVESEGTMLLMTQEADGTVLPAPVSTELFSEEVIHQVLEQKASDAVVDGLLSLKDDRLSITVRLSRRNATPELWTRDAPLAELEPILAEAHAWIAEQMGIQGCPSFSIRGSKPEAFLKYLEGYDAVMLAADPGQGRTPQTDYLRGLDALLEATALDPSLQDAYVAAIRLADSLIHARLASPQEIEERLKKMAAANPEDPRVHRTLADLYRLTGRAQDAINAMDKAVALAQASGNVPPEAVAELLRYRGVLQQSAGMLANAELSFRRAAEVEPYPKPSLDLLVDLLFETNRSHEAPGLWREVIDLAPERPDAWIRYAMVLHRLERKEDAKKALEEALEKTSGNTLIKRYLASVLAEAAEYDRALDFYEDFLDAYPDHAETWFEYARVLGAAGRKHEVPDALRRTLEANPSQNIRAHAQAWLFELENPKRVEAMKLAAEKVDRGELDSAVEDLEKLVEWMPTYWKAWAFLANLYNRVGRHVDAERAAKHTLNLYPGSEPTYVDLVNSLIAQERYEDADRLLTELALTGVQSLPLMISHAIVMKRLGRHDAARRIAAFVREAVDPGNQEVQKALAEIEGQ